MFNHLKGFLKTKGIEMQEGAYTQRIRRGCELLTDSVNLSQDALRRAKASVDKGLDQLRQVIHEQTAPKPAAAKPKTETTSQPKQPKSDTRASKKSSATRSKFARAKRRNKRAKASAA